MSVVVLTIAGSTKQLKAGSLRISQTANGRTTAAFDVISTDGTYRPALDAEVIITEDGTRIFGGLIDRATEKGATKGSAHPGIITSISAIDFHAYTERRYVKQEISTGSLHAALTYLVNGFLDDYGVSLHGSQVTGPTLPALSYDYVQVTNFLNEVTTLAGKDTEKFVWRIDFFKVLRAFQPSTSAAPFDIDGTTLPIVEVLGDIEVEPTREHYANRIILKVPSKTETGRVETFTANGTDDTFPLQYTLTGMRYTVQNDGADELLDFEGAGFDLAVQWLYDADANAIVRKTSGVSDPPDTGNTISITFDGTYTGEAIAEDAGEIAANGLWEKVVVVDSVPNDTTAEELAEAHLAQCLPLVQKVKYRTFEAGLAPGQLQNINVPLRDIDNDFVITDVVTRDLGRDRLVRDVSCVVDNQTNLGKGWRDVYKTWAGDKTGGNQKNSPAPAAVVGAGGVSRTIGAAPPDRAIQFNDTGAFGGDSALIWYQDENSIVCGGNGSSITATEFESCQVFGSNCHIADPS